MTLSLQMDQLVETLSSTMEIVVELKTLIQQWNRNIYNIQGKLEDLQLKKFQSPLLVDILLSSVNLASQFMVQLDFNTPLVILNLPKATSNCNVC